MKKIIGLLVLVLLVGFISCDKEMDSKEQQIEQVRQAKLSQCGSDSHLISRVHLPENANEATKKQFFEMAFGAVIQGQSYMQIDQKSSEMVISVYRFSVAFPYDAPQAERTLYMGENQATAALAGALAQMNYQCLPVVVFQWDDVWVVEDCC